MTARWAGLLAGEQTMSYDGRRLAGVAPAAASVTSHSPRAGRAAAAEAAGDGPRSGVLEEMAQVLAVLARVNQWLRCAGESGHGAEASVVVGLLERLGRADAAVAAATSRAIVVAEESGCADADGQASCSEWVAARLRLSGRAGARAVGLAAGLDQLPDVLAALEAGEISRDHATSGLVEAFRRQQRGQEAADRARRREREQAEREAREQVEAAQRQAADEAERQRLEAQAEAEAEARHRAAQAEQQRRERAAAAEAERRARQAELLGRAHHGDSPDQVAEAADRLRAADAEALATSEAAQRQERDLRSWTDRRTGSGRGSWTVPAEEQDILLALLDSLRTFDAKDCEPCERRSFGRRQADAFIDMIRLGADAARAPTSRGQRPHLNVTVPIATLIDEGGAAGEGGAATGEGDEGGATGPTAGAPGQAGQGGKVTGRGDRAGQPGRTRYGTHLSPDAVRRIACDAKLVRIVLGAHSQVLDVGRATRNWTAAQFTAAEHTFGGCGFPVADDRLCGRPAGWTQLHHVHWWERGGPTDLDNGVPLCLRHHWAVHHDGWDLAYDHPAQHVTVTRRRADGTVCQRTVDLARHRNPTTQHDPTGQTAGPTSPPGPQPNDQTADASDRDPRRKLRPWQEHPASTITPLTRHPTAGGGHSLLTPLNPRPPTCPSTRPYQRCACPRVDGEPTPGNRDVYTGAPRTDQPPCVIVTNETQTRAHGPHETTGASSSRSAGAGARTRDADLPTAHDVIAAWTMRPAVLLGANCAGEDDDRSGRGRRADVASFGGDDASVGAG